MLPNVIILTGGISGSSVLAGLIARAGYWLGDETEKVAYDTFENSRLVNLNIQVLRHSGYFWRDIADIPTPSAKKIEDISESIDLSIYERFLQECNGNLPWLWKDPRLGYTIFFWKKLLDLEKCKFIMMRRDLKQAWTGMILREGFPISLDKLAIIHRECIKSSHNFLDREGFHYHDLTFEDLINDPEKSIYGINQFIGIHLDISDLREIYKGPLYKSRWTKRDFFKAKLKFLYYKHISRDIIRFPRKKYS